MLLNFCDWSDGQKRNLLSLNGVNDSVVAERKRINKAIDTCKMKVRFYQAVLISCSSPVQKMPRLVDYTEMSQDERKSGSLGTPGYMQWKYIPEDHLNRNAIQVAEAISSLRRRLSESPGSTTGLVLAAELFHPTQSSDKNWGDSPQNQALESITRLSVTSDTLSQQ